MSNELDDALASGDEQAIEEALAGSEISENMLFDDADEQEAASDKPAEEVNDEQNSDKNDVAEVDEQPIEAAPEPSPAEEQSKSSVIERDGKYFVEVSKDNAELESKNGKHKLPYDLLAGKREENLALKKQLENQQQTAEELQASLDESKRVAELHSKQLAENGLDPKLLPEQMLKDPELMAQVKEDYPQIGELVEALAAQLQQSSTAPQSPDTAQQSEIPSSKATDPFEQAFSETANLKNWQQNDADRWDMAKLIDSQLAKDPSFDSKSHAERFEEVEKRVMSVFGDEVTPAAIKAQPHTKAPAQPPKSLIPNSPTELGHQGSDLSASSQFMDKDAGTMTHQMENMSDAQIEAMLEEASDFL